MALITDENDNLAPVPSGECRVVKRGIYLVRSLAGFQEAKRHFAQIYHEMSSNWEPVMYPSLVALSYHYRDTRKIHAQYVDLGSLKHRMADFGDRT